MTPTSIPDNFIIQCPMRENILRKAVSCCQECEFFKGLAEISQSPEAKWSQKYRIMCGFPRVMKGWEIEQ